MEFLKRIWKSILLRNYKSFNLSLLDSVNKKQSALFKVELKNNKT